MHRLETSGPFSTHLSFCVFNELNKWNKLFFFHPDWSVLRFRCKSTFIVLYIRIHYTMFCFHYETLWKFGSFVVFAYVSEKKKSPSVQALNMMEWVWLWVNSIHQPSVLLNCPGGWWIIHDMRYTFIFLAAVGFMSFSNGDWLRDNDAITWKKHWCVAIKVANAAVVLVDPGY